MLENRTDNLLFVEAMPFCRIKETAAPRCPSHEGRHFTASICCSMHPSLQERGFRPFPNHQSGPCPISEFSLVCQISLRNFLFSCSKSFPGVFYFFHLLTITAINTISAIIMPMSATIPMTFIFFFLSL